MPLLTVEGLILRNLRLGDTSRVVTVLSRELGRFAAVAKGVRAPRSRFGASLEILNLSSLVVYYRPGRDLQMISEGTLDREYRGLLRGAERYHHGCAVLEFLDRVLESEASVPELFKLSTRVLGLMEDAPRGRLRYLFRAFQLRAVGWLGYPPRVEGCTSCGRSEVVAFGPLEGGGLCRSCAEGRHTALPLQGETLRILRRLQQGALPRTPSPKVVAEIDTIAEEFLGYHIDRYRGLRSLNTLQR